MCNMGAANGTVGQICATWEWRTGLLDRYEERKLKLYRKILTQVEECVE
jgi:hypothetical protein